MVFTFEHVGLDQEPGLGKWALQRRCRCRCSRRNLAWQAGLADVGWNSLYWDNHDQPRAVSRFGDDSPEHRVASAKTLGDRAAPAPRHAVRLPGRGARHDQRRLHRRSRSTRDIESLNYHATRWPAAYRSRRSSCSRCARRAATTPAPRCSGTPPSTPASPPAMPWLPVNPNHDEINAAAAVADPDSVFHHYRRLIELRHTDDVVVDGRFDAAAARRRPQVWAFTRTLGRRRCCSCWRTARRGRPRWTRGRSRTWRAPRCCCRPMARRGA